MGRITASQKQLKGDPVYKSLLASKFINCLMHDGKKTVAQLVFYDALKIIGEKVTDKSPIDVFLTAVENVKPDIEVRSKRVGGASYQVPMRVLPIFGDCKIVPKRLPNLPTKKSKQNFCHALRKAKHVRWT